jgi:DNA-binding CsgD family transcriptional regulator
VLAAALSLALGDALAAARRLEQRLRHLQEHRLQLGAALDLLVDAYLDAGQLDPAAGAAARLAATAAAGTSRQLAALASYASGRVALARGDGAAVADLEAALKQWSSLELPLEAARTRFELARALAASESEAAIEYARHALAGFESLGAARDADRAAAFLRSAGVVPRTGPKGTGTLTVREREVLALVGAGLSNPEIAARLHISRKTASHHVSSILTKLGLRNRAEAAAHLGRQMGQLPDADRPDGPARSES